MRYDFTARMQAHKDVAIQRGSVGGKNYRKVNLHADYAPDELGEDYFEYKMALANVALNDAIDSINPSYTLEETF